ncbi:MAG: heparan-alpha-glucosaminide N-acetyltransferase domain-containing protein [[Clostridium] leptum]
MPAPCFVSSDYYPLLPWIFLFFCGSLLGRILVGRETVRRCCVPLPAAGLWGGTAL